MKTLLIAALAVWASVASAAIARVTPVHSGPVSVAGTHTGVMPVGTNESLPQNQRQMDRNDYTGEALSPVMFGLWTPIQFPWQDFDVAGLRLDILGTCCNFDGFDLGLVGIAKNHSNGVRLNLVSYAFGDGMGLDVGGVNVFRAKFYGLQVGLANWVDDQCALCQIGLLNFARDARGCQLGVVNLSSMLEGVQVGLVNVNHGSGTPFMPIVNCYF